MRVLLADVDTSGHRIEYARYLIHHFIAESHDVYYCTCGDDDRLSELSDLGATVELFDSLPGIHSTWDSLTYRIALTDYLTSVFDAGNDWDADVVHLLSMDSSELSLAVPLVRHRNSSWRFYGTYFNQRLIKNSGNILGRAYRSMQRITIRKLVESDFIDGLFVHHPSIQEEAAARLDIGDNYISVIPDPVVAPSIDSTKAELRTELSLPTNETILLFFGATRTGKGPDILLDALTRIKGKRFTVVFAGPADEVGLDDIERMRSEINDAISIESRFGFVKEDDIYKYYIASDAVLLPYRAEYRGTSGILQRAIAVNRPVVSTSTGVLDAVIEEWGAGVVVEPGTADDFARAIETFLDGRRALVTGEENKNDAFLAEHNWKSFADSVLKSYGQGD